MAIMRWRPWGDLVSVEDEMNQLFGDFLGRVPARRAEPAQRWCPAVDIYENEDSLHIDVEIPGMKKEEIRVSLENNVLSLRGEKKQQKEVKEVNYYRWERRHDSFSRAFELPMPVQSDKINASYKNGVLSVVLPKTEQVKPKDIPIEVK